MSNNLEYKMKIEPKILTLLGPNLYTNIYFVLAELIANSYDADSGNVHLFIEENKITIEDDGNGMSYQEINEKFLDVAAESRKNKAEEKTQKYKRLKMGRKGVGKLAALSVSDNVDVMTMKNGTKSGFIMTTEIADDGILEEIPQSKIVFKFIENNGTSISMNNIKLKINKQISTIKNNLTKIFPIFSKEFKLHIHLNGKTEVIESYNKEIFKTMSSIITVGNKFNDFGKGEIKFRKDYDFKGKNITIKDKNGNLVEKNLSVEGWIGTFKSVKGQKKDISDFQESHLSIFANGKMGEFNILQRIGKNKLGEMYVVGELHVDLFEESDIIDMTLSNREGYKTNDLRYIEAEKIFRELLDEVLALRNKYSDELKKEAKQKAIDTLKEKEEELKRNLSEYDNKLKEKVSESFSKFNEPDFDLENMKNDLIKEIKLSKNILNIKTEIEQKKKNILISQTEDDKKIADIIFNMLIFNGVEPEQIIYSNSDEEKSRISCNIYEYLSNFFVKSCLNSELHVIYITSDKMKDSWGVLCEIGAGWITKSNHTIFNINDFRPGEPLNVGAPYNNIKIDKEQNITIKTHYFDDFCSKIMKICEYLKIKPKTKEQNKAKLINYLDVI